MDDTYENIEQYNPNNDLKIFIEFVLVNDTTLVSDNPLHFRNNLLERI